MCVVVKEFFVEEYMEGMETSVAEQSQTVGDVISLSSDRPLSPKWTDCAFEWETELT